MWKIQNVLGILGAVVSRRLDEDINMSSPAHRIEDHASKQIRYSAVNLHNMIFFNTKYINMYLFMNAYVELRGSEQASHHGICEGVLF